MIHQFLGYRTNSRNEIPTILHVGDDVDEGAKVAAKKAADPALKIVRVGVLKNFEHLVLPVAIPETESAKAARIKAEASARKDRQEFEAKTQAAKATALLEKAKKEFAEAEAAMKALASNPDDPELQRKAAKEKAEADAAATAAKKK
jgi:hypothetical protein